MGTAELAKDHAILPSWPRDVRPRAGAQGFSTSRACFALDSVRSTVCTVGYDEFGIICYSGCLEGEAKQAESLRNVAPARGQYLTYYSPELVECEIHNFMHYTHRKAYESQYQTLLLLYELISKFIQSILSKC